MSDTTTRPLQLFSQEKLEEFRDMSLKARLIWLEDANSLAMKVLGLKRLAVLDARFQLPAYDCVHEDDEGYDYTKSK
jgi:hypothetical protein